MNNRIKPKPVPPEYNSDSMPFSQEQHETLAFKLFNESTFADPAYPEHDTMAIAEQSLIEAAKILRTTMN